MGAADIVPGVSGGTIALVFGIYERLLRNVRIGAQALGSLVKFQPAQFLKRFLSIEWTFIIPLGVGLLIAIASLTSLIDRLLDERPEEMAGFFFGLVVGSIFVAVGLLHRKTGSNYAIMVGVGAVAFFLLGFQSTPSGSPPLWAFFGAGTIAICAMILPGISGSFLLLMMGMYAAVFTALHDRDIVSIGVFGLGTIVGLALFSTALGWLLEHHHDVLLASLIGLMLGSFRLLWPWPNGVGIISEEPGESKSGTGLELPTADNFVVPVLLAVGACVAVVVITRFMPDDTDQAEPKQSASV